MGAAGYPPVDGEGYSGTRVAKIVGISYRQLDYWARPGLVEHFREFIQAVRPEDFA